MSREIKFRFWLTDFKRFAEKLHDGTYWDMEDWLNPNTKNHVIPQQFTGLIDKNGKEIYEGDIIKIPIYFNVNLKIIWELFGWQICNAVDINNFDNEMWDENKRLACYRPEDIEIIGNIFETPDLLKA